MKKHTLSLVSAGLLCIAASGSAMANNLKDSSDYGITNQSTITWKNTNTGAGCKGITFPKEIVAQKTFIDNPINVDRPALSPGEQCTATYIYSDQGGSIEIDLSVINKSSASPLEFQVNGQHSHFLANTTAYGFYFKLNPQVTK